MQKCYEGVEISRNTDMIRKVCKSLRKYQRFYASQPEKDKQPVQYYKGNISTVDIQTLDPQEWLNDQIMNRYLGRDLNQLSNSLIKILRVSLPAKSVKFSPNIYGSLISLIKN